MRNQKALFGSAAIGVLIALTMAPGAEAKTHKKHVAHAPAVNSQMNVLAEQVDVLMNRVNEETAARQQDEAQLQQAQTDAAAARADAQAARSQRAEQIQVIPGEVNQAIAANKPKPSWADNTTVGATIFANASNIDQHP